MQPALEFKHIIKRFSGILALDDVSINFEPGEVHALVGENGAGKSTLIKTCTGALKPTSGTIIVNGKNFTSLTPSISRENGIGVIYQEFNLVNDLSVAENVFLGEPIKKGWIIDKKSMAERCKEIFSVLNININPNVLIRDLTVGFQQMVEMAKALVKQTQILIMDEPSAPLTTSEVESMFSVVRQLKASGVTVVYISHRLDEIFDISDRVSVLRDGQLVSTRFTKDTNRGLLVKEMVGRELNETFPQREKKEGGKVLMEVNGLTGKGVYDISFKLKKGEILGLGGLIGAGRTEMAELLFGVKKLEAGSILIDGKPYVPKNTAKAIDNGIALVPEDRKRQGAFLNLSIKDNICMASVKRISKFGVIDSSKQKALVNQFKESLHIKSTNTDQLVKDLSGGNQQKVVLAKELALEPKIMIMDEPTRGIDVGAKHEIYLLMDKMVQEGKTIIMISSEMEELMGMSDRIIVLNEGYIVGELSKNEFNQEAILHCASKNISKRSGCKNE